MQNIYRTPLKDHGSLNQSHYYTIDNRSFISQYSKFSELSPISHCNQLPIMREGGNTKKALENTQQITGVQFQHHFKPKIFDPIVNDSFKNQKFNNPSFSVSNKSNVSEIPINHLLFVQVNQLSDNEQTKFINNCLTFNQSNPKVELFSNKELVIKQQIMQVKGQFLQVQLQFLNISDKCIDFLELLVNTDQTLLTSMNIATVRQLHPNTVQSVDLQVQIISLPFTFITLSIEYNSQYVKSLLPITIFNFINKGQATEKLPFTKRIPVPSNMNIVQNVPQLQQYAGEIFGRQCNVYCQQSENQTLQCICSSSLEEICHQILTTMHLLLKK